MARHKTSKRRVATNTPLKRIIFLTAAIVLVLVFLIVYSGGLWREGRLEGNDSIFSGTQNIEKELKYNVFGDNFVNDIYIDWDKTNLHYDKVATAFTFQPLYEWLEKGTCLDRFCGLTAVDWGFPDSGLENNFFGVFEEYCLGSKGCLKAEGVDVFYQDKKIEPPLDIRDKEISNISIYPLLGEWLVGFVFYDDKQEQGRAYRFNGRTFVSLDAKNSIPLLSRSGFEGARFGFGGDAESFLVLYGGYDLLGYQVIDGRLFDIHDFLGLRISDGGFAPQIIKQKVDDETLWYICSRSSGKPRLVKLWQNSSENIKGAISLTDKLLQEKEGAESAWCRGGDNLGELEVMIMRGGAYYWRTFQDQGFRQNFDYRLTTSNLFKEKGKIVRASFRNLKACGLQACDSGALVDSLKFFVSGDGEEFQLATLDKDIIFPTDSSGLYWLIEATSYPDMTHYSPWIDGLLAISYAWR